MLPKSTTFLIACSLTAALGSSGCYGFSGGGGLPSHMNTAFVPPVENDTPRFTLTERMTQSLLDAVRSKLGLQLAAEGEADLIVTARITRYSDVALNFDAREGEGTQVFQRRITITAAVEIFDTQLEEMYWSSQSVTGVGEYAPETEQEEVGETIALENLTQKIVDGAQSDW
ncbi:MAG: LPS assembly lipoprotein LptE [Gemmatimonadales bacterium]|jgi:hypothetical protein